MTYFVYLDSMLASDAKDKQAAIKEAAESLISRLQLGLTELGHEGETLDGDLEWHVEEEE